jgi:bifunctional non-homologous end joining protein LigD
MAKKVISSIPVKEFFAEKEQRGNAIVKVGKRSVALSNLHKVYWSEEGYTKFDLLKYYYTVFDTIAPYLAERPLILKRYPNGIKGQMFYQHNLENPPEYLETFAIQQKDGTDVNYAIVDELADLLYIVNLGTIAQNPFHSRTGSLSTPDYFAFDLDPGDTATFEQVKKLALEVKEVLDDLGIQGYPKTSGSTGIHIYVPIKPEYSYDDVVAFSKEVARIVSVRNPDDATIERMTRNRKKSQIYVDYLQNIEGKSIAAAYSVREKPHATVSAPLDWKEINKRLRLDMFTIETMPARIRKKGDLFLPVLKKRQSLKAAMKRLEKMKP